jgi:hypothetical protein
MATDITTQLDDAREATLLRLVAEYNERTNEGLSPAQFFRNYARVVWLDAETQRYNDSLQLKLRAAYKLATPEEQATIDGILNKYRQ